MTLLPHSTSRLDLGLLDEVEIHLRKLIDSTTALELEVKEPDDASGARPSWETIETNLLGWQDRLDEWSRRSAALEQDLTAQEHALRGWFESVALQKKMLRKIADGEISEPRPSGSEPLQDLTPPAKEPAE